MTPFAYQVSGGFQRELPFNTRLSIQYVGSRGRHLACPNDACNDQIPLSTVQKFGAHINDLVPNPFYGIVTNSSSILSQPTVQQWRLLMNWPQFTGGSLHMPAAQNQKGFPLFDTQYPFKSSWNALLLSYEKRFSGGLELLVAYTWSKTISNADAFETWMAPTPFYQNIFEVEKEKSSLERRRAAAFGDQPCLRASLRERQALRIPSAWSRGQAHWRLGTRREPYSCKRHSAVL